MSRIKVRCILDDDPDSESQVGGALVIGVGAGELAGSISLFFTSAGSLGAFSDLNDQLAELRKAGVAPAQIVATIESAWQTKVTEARSLRQVSGTLGVGLGALCLAGGTYLGLKDLSSLSKSERLGYSAAFLGLGGASLVLGFRSLFLEESIETAWHGYRARSSRLHPSVTDVGYAPISGGGALSIRGSF